MVILLISNIYFKFKNTPVTFLKDIYKKTFFFFYNLIFIKILAIDYNDKKYICILCKLIINY